MRAAVFHGREDIRIENLPEPTPGAGEVLLEVHAAGICGTDAGEYGYGPNLFPIHRAHPITGHQGPMVPGSYARACQNSCLLFGKSCDGVVLV